MKKQLVWLLQFPMSKVEDMYRQGQIGQLAYEAYYVVWEWSYPKFGGTPGWRHDRYWQQYGKERYYAKINKVRVAFGFTPIPLS